MFTELFNLVNNNEIRAWSHYQIMSAGFVIFSADESQPDSFLQSVYPCQFSWQRTGDNRPNFSCTILRTESICKTIGKTTSPGGWLKGYWKIGRVMGQLWSRAVGGHEDNNQSPIAVAIRDNNSQEVHTSLLFWIAVFPVPICIFIHLLLLAWALDLYVTCNFRWVDFWRKV